MWKWNVWVWAEDEGKELCGMQPTEQKDAWNGGRSGGLLSASPDSDRRGVRLPALVASEQSASISSRAVCRRRMGRQGTSPCDGSRARHRAITMEVSDV